MNNPLVHHRVGGQIPVGGVDFPHQTTLQPVVWLCNNDECREGKPGLSGAVPKFAFEADHPTCPKCGAESMSLRKEKAVEVGNIFSLGAKFSEPLGLTYVDEKNEKKPVIMGSYGLGPSRAMGAIVELLSDEHGIVWPASVAPFAVHLVALFDKEGKTGAVAKAADKLYADLTSAGIETLYDDRDSQTVRAGEKFADSDLLGIPTRLVVSERGLAAGEIEVKDRKTGEMKKVKIGEVVQICTK